MNVEVKIDSDRKTVALTVGDLTKVFNLVEVEENGATAPESAATAPAPTSLTVMTWNVDNWSTKKNHAKSISADQSAEYAQKVREMLANAPGGVPTLLGLQEYGVVFDMAGAMATDTALTDYPEAGHFEWLKNGKKADYWAPGGFSNNSSMVNGLPARVLYDALWLWGPYATRARCKKAGVVLPYYYDNVDGSRYVPEGLTEAIVTTPISEFAHVLEVEVGGKRVAWANLHLFPKSSRKDYPYCKDVVNWLCLQNLMAVLSDYEHVILSGDFNWISKQFMLDYDEAVAVGAALDHLATNAYRYEANYPIVTTPRSDGHPSECNRYKYAGLGKLGFVSADYAINGYGQTTRGEGTNFDKLSSVDGVVVRGFRITEARMISAADWFDKDHRPVAAGLEKL